MYILTYIFFFLVVRILECVVLVVVDLTGSHISLRLPTIYLEIVADKFQPGLFRWNEFRPCNFGYKRTTPNFDISVANEIQYLCGSISSLKQKKKNYFW